MGDKSIINIARGTQNNIPEKIPAKILVGYTKKCGVQCLKKSIISLLKILVGKSVVI